MIKLILKFGIVGVFNTLLDYTIFQVLVFAFDIKAPVFIFLANTTSTTIAAINSFFLNKKWTFQNKSERYMRQFAIFFVINIFSIGISDASLILFNHLFPIYVMVGHISLRSTLFTKVMAVAITMVFNFVAYRKFVFTVERDYNVS